MRAAPRSLWFLPVLLLIGGCSDKQCDPLPDLGQLAELGADAAREAPPPTCRKDQVKCAAGELNAFGICLAESTMAKVAGGEFTMGQADPGKPWDPAHKVTLKAYQIDLTEVTVEQYQACVDCGACQRPLRNGSNTGREPYYGNPEFAKFPVIYTTWQDASDYCKGIGKRLPTEAEWELAARGTSGADYPWGATAPTTKQANYGGLNNDTVAVTDNAAGKSPSGLLNMAGNVWEWVNDTYDPAYYAKSPPADPPGPASGEIKVIRGGGFNSSIDRIKTYIRVGEAELAAYSYLGFRCAK